MKALCRGGVSKRSVLSAINYSDIMDSLHSYNFFLPSLQWRTLIDIKQRHRQSVSCDPSANYHWYWWSINFSCFCLANDRVRQNALRESESEKDKNFFLFFFGGEPIIWHCSFRRSIIERYFHASILPTIIDARLTFKSFKTLFRNQIMNGKTASSYFFFIQTERGTCFCKLLNRVNCWILTWLTNRKIVEEGEA